MTDVAMVPAKGLAYAGVIGVMGGFMLGFSFAERLVRHGMISKLSATFFRTLCPLFLSVCALCYPQYATAAQKSSVRTLATVAAGTIAATAAFGTVSVLRSRAAA